MEELRELISACRYLNSTPEKSVGLFTPSLIGMFGSATMFDVFLASLDDAFSSGRIPEPLKRRVINLSGTFIPQVAGFNGIEDFASLKVSPEQLRSIRCDSPEERKRGVRMILAALMMILEEAKRLD